MSPLSLILLSIAGIVAILACGVGALVWLGSKIGGPHRTDVEPSEFADDPDRYRDGRCWGDRP